MSVNKTSGNMYEWIDSTWNPIRGVCSHKCIYCSIHAMATRFNSGYQPPIHLEENALKDKLTGKGTIFVGSSTDLFASDIPKEWIIRVFDHCKKYPINTYLFQTKNPIRFLDFIQSDFPPKTILGITLETNRDTSLISYAPLPNDRIEAFTDQKLSWAEKMINVEPVMDFDPVDLLNMIRRVRPSFVSVGADSKANDIPEPASEKLKFLLSEIDKFTVLKQKKNLQRMLK